MKQWTKTNGELKLILEGYSFGYLKAIKDLVMLIYKKLGNKYNTMHYSHKTLPSQRLTFVETNRFLSKCTRDRKLWVIANSKNLTCKISILLNLHRIIYKVSVQFLCIY